MEKTTGNKTKSKHLTLAVFVIVNVLVIAVVAYVEFGKGSASASKGDLLDINPLYLLPVLGCFVAAICAEWLKYYMMMKHTLGKSMPRQAFEVAALGKYYDNITPLGAGWQPSQIAYLMKQGVEAGHAAAIPIAGFVAMQSAFVLIAIAAFIFGGGVVDSVPMKVAAVAGLLFYIFFPLIIFVFAVMPRMTEKIIGFFIRLGGKMKLLKSPEKTMVSLEGNLRASIASMSSIGRERGLFIGTLVLSLLYHGALCSMPYFVLRAFGNNLPYLTVFYTTVFIYLCITFVPTPGNSGGAEGSFYALFSVLGQGHLFWAMLVWRFFCYYMFLVVGILIIFGGILKKKGKSAA